MLPISISLTLQIGFRNAEVSLHFRPQSVAAKAHVSEGKRGGSIL